MVHRFWPSLAITLRAPHTNNFHDAIQVWVSVTHPNTNCIWKSFHKKYMLKPTLGDVTWTTFSPSVATIVTHVTTCNHCNWIAWVYQEKVRTLQLPTVNWLFFSEGLYFQENFIWKTSILKTRTIKSLKEEETGKWVCACQTSNLSQLKSNDSAAAKSLVWHSPTHLATFRQKSFVCGAL